MKPIACLFLIMLMLSACRQPPARKNEISKIEFATGWCYGSCQYTAMSIDSSLKYEFYGGKRALGGKSIETIKGFYVSKINNAFWDTLNEKFEKINYKNLRPSYIRSVDDQSLELIIHYQHDIKRIRAQWMALPENVRDVFSWLADSYKTLKLQPVKDSIRFETTIQYAAKPLVSNSISQSKKVKAFVSEYYFKGTRINGLRIQNMFVENSYTINKGTLFGPYDIDPDAPQLVIVFKDPLTKTYNKNWTLRSAPFMEDKMDGADFANHLFLKDDHTLYYFLYKLSDTIELRLTTNTKTIPVKSTINLFRVKK